MDDLNSVTIKRESEWLGTANSTSFFLGVAGFLSTCAGAVMALQDRTMHGVLFASIGILFVFVSVVIGLMVRDFRREREESKRSLSEERTREMVMQMEGNIYRYIDSRFAEGEKKTDSLEVSVDRRIAGIYDSIERIENDNIPKIKDEILSEERNDTEEMWSAIRRLDDSLDLIKGMISGKK